VSSGNKTWKELGIKAISYNRNAWLVRAKIAGDMLKKVDLDAICDLGCGQMLLRDYLKDGIKYYGYDEIDIEGVKYLDLRKSLPPVPHEKKSAAVFLGVIESLGDERVKHILKWISERFLYILVSYGMKKGIRPLWATQLTSTEFLSYFITLGDIIESKTWRHQSLYLLKCKENHAGKH